jgi:hypothetical protein
VKTWFQAFAFQLQLVPLYTSAAEDLSRAAALFDAEPNLDPGEVRDIMERVPRKSSTAGDGHIPGGGGGSARR